MHRFGALSVGFTHGHESQSQWMFSLPAQFPAVQITARQGDFLIFSRHRKFGSSVGEACTRLGRSAIVCGDIEQTIEIATDVPDKFLLVIFVCGDSPMRCLIDRRLADTAGMILPPFLIYESAYEATRSTHDGSCVALTELHSRVLSEISGIGKEHSANRE